MEVVNLHIAENMLNKTAINKQHFDKTKEPQSQTFL